MHFAIYALSLLMHTAASPDPDPNPRGGVNHPTVRVQFHANECNEGRDANPQPQERNSTLTSGPSGGPAPTHTIYTRGGGQPPNPKSSVPRQRVQQEKRRQFHPNERNACVRVVVHPYILAPGPLR